MRGPLHPSSPRQHAAPYTLPPPPPWQEPFYLSRLLPNEMEKDAVGRYTAGQREDTHSVYLRSVFNTTRLRPDMVGVRRMRGRQCAPPSGRGVRRCENRLLRRPSSKRISPTSTHGLPPWSTQSTLEASTTYFSSEAARTVASQVLVNGETVRVRGSP